MVQVELQTAALADLGALLELMRGYYRDDALQFDPAQHPAALQRLLTHPDLGRVWLIRLQNQMVGYVAVCFGFSLELAGNDAYIDEL